MGTVFRRSQCQVCWGTGEVTHNISPGSPLVTESCSNCAGTGMIQSSTSGFDDTLLNDTLDKVNDVLDKCNDIKEKVDEIMDKLNE